MQTAGPHKPRGEEGARTMRALTLHLDDFGREALEQFVRQRRDSHSAAVRIASLYYLADRDEGRPAWRVPSCAADAIASPGVTVRLDEETWKALHNEAERQDVSAAELIRHAVLYFLADVDSGRVGVRLERALGDADKRT
jgi:predicted DNA-binding ribbon-helix-helix protein